MCTFSGVEIVLIHYLECKIFSCLAILFVAPDGILELGRNKQQRKRVDLIILLLLLGNDYVCTYVISLLPSGLIPTLTLGKARRKGLPTPEGIFVKRELKRLMLPKKGGTKRRTKNNNHEFGRRWIHSRYQA